MPLPSFITQIPPMLEEHNPPEHKGLTDAAIERAYLQCDFDTMVDLVAFKTDVRAWMRKHAEAQPGGSEHLAAVALGVPGVVAVAVFAAAMSSLWIMVKAPKHMRDDVRAAVDDATPVGIDVRFLWWVAA